MSKFVMVDSHTLPEADYHQEKEILGNAGIECVLAKCKSADEVAEAAADAECVGTVYQRFDEALIARLPKLKLIVRYGIGYDVVDVAACSKHHVALCNLPTYCIEDVATHCMALMLDITRKTTMYDRQIRSGNWDVGYGYANHRLSVQTLGLAGVGHIARKVCSYAQGFGMNVIAYDPFCDQTLFKKYGATQCDLDTLLSQSDILSLHVPCTDETRHMINSNTLSKMKHGALIVNTSRGALVDNKALCAALKSGQIAAAGLDVNEDEPITDPSHPLLELENTVITPHSAYNSVEASDTQHTHAAQTVVTFLSGTIPENTVNRKAL